MALALAFGWFDLRGARRRGTSAMRAPIMASRDLPPLPSLPRSPDPLPEEALLFARGAAQRTAEQVADPSDDAGAGTPRPALSIADGVDLRAMLNRVVEASRRRDQAAQARDRIVERLSAGKAGLSDGATLHLLRQQALPAAGMAGASSDDHAARLDRAMEEALASALKTLRQLSGLTRD